MAIELTALEIEPYCVVDIVLFASASISEKISCLKYSESEIPLMFGL